MKYEETELIELKRSVDKDFARKVVAFLNTNGGIIYVGVDDITHISVKDLDTDESMKRIVNAINDQIYPNAQNMVSISSFKDNDNTVIKVVVTKSNTLHCIKEYGLTPKGCPKRIGSVLKDMDQREIDEKIQYVLFEKLGITGIASTKKELTFNKLKHLFVEKGFTINENEFLSNIPGIFTYSGKYSLFAELLSDKNNLSIVVAVFRGVNKADFARRISFDDTCLIELYRNVLDYCQTIINDVRTIKNENNNWGEREDIRRFDNSAFTEAWLNAITYNDWTNGNSPIVCVFDDRIEITSNGSLPGNLTIEEFFSGKSRPRCKELSDLLTKLRISEHTGHGINLILDKYDNDKSIFSITENFVTVTFKYPSIVYEEIKRLAITVNSNFSKLSSIAKDVLSIIEENPNILTDDIAESLMRGKRTIERAISELKSLNFISKDKPKIHGRWNFNKS